MSCKISPLAIVAIMASIQLQYTGICFAQSSVGNFDFDMGVKEHFALVHCTPIDNYNIDSGFVGRDNFGNNCSGIFNSGDCNSWRLLGVARGRSTPAATSRVGTELATSFVVILY